MNISMWPKNKKMEATFSQARKTAMKKISMGVLLGVALAGLNAGAGWFGLGAPQYRSPTLVLPSGAPNAVFVTEFTAGRVAEVDLATGKELRSFKTATAPTGLARDAKNNLLFVTTDGPDAKIVAFNLASGRQAFELPAGHTPMAPVLTADGQTLFVCYRFNNVVAAFDLGTKKEVARIAVPREPVAAALTPDGRLLVVANHLPAMAASGDYVAAQVSLIDAAAKKVLASVTLPNGSTSLRGVCLAPDGRYAYVTHTLSRYQLPTTQLERGWMNTSALSIVDLTAKKLLTTVLLDDVDLGAANPWGVALTADGRWLCVAHAGTHEVSVLDRAGVHAKLDAIAAGKKVSNVSATLDDVPNDLSFLVDLRRRIKLGGNGPRGLAIVGNTAVAAQYFTDDLAVVNLDPAVAHPARVVELGPRATQTQARKGEMYFNDAHFCFQQWQSCTTCHPDDRADALNWDLLNDGIGNPKNTKNMLLTHATPPSMSLGVREGAEAAVRAGLKFIQFAVRPEEDAQAIDAYLKTMKPTPSPYLVNGKLSAAAKRGEKVFKTAGCAKCHPAPLFTDLLEYDLGLAKGLDAGKPFDTPSLIECWRTAPYLYDGRAYTMKDVLTTCNPQDKHGVTSKLTPAELDDLIAYILSL
jgi:DNA-binding beta-propeller fold protein YncE